MDANTHRKQKRKGVNEKMCVRPLKRQNFSSCRETLRTDRWFFFFFPCPLSLTVTHCHRLGRAQHREGHARTHTQARGPRRKRERSELADSSRAMSAAAGVVAAPRVVLSSTSMIARRVYTVSDICSHTFISIPTQHPHFFFQILSPKHR